MLLKRLRAFAIIGLLIVALAACETESAGPEAGVTVDDLEAVQERLDELDNRFTALEDDLAATIDDELAQPAADIIGSEVTVSGEVSDVIPESEQAFVMGGDLWSFDDGVLVVSSNGEPFEAGISDGQLVAVTGTVKNFVIADFEAEYGWDVDDNLLADWENKIAIAVDPGNVDGLVPGE